MHCFPPSSLGWLSGLATIAEINLSRLKFNSMHQNKFVCLAGVLYFQTYSMELGCL